MRCQPSTAGLSAFQVVCPGPAKEGTLTLTLTDTKVVSTTSHIFKAGRQAGL